MSWLKKVGSFLGKVLHVVATEAKPVNDLIEPVVASLFPQFSGVLEIEKNWVDRVAAQAVKVEAVAAAAGQASGTGSQKLAQVLSSAEVNAAIDAWVAARFPGSGKVSDVARSGLISAIVGVINEVTPQI